ncbi:MAG: hypothetical protein BEV12_23955 [Microcystis aeruginosa CACIAM 03]|nr:MAG: hypothetical protein BEV12_23955 [Microcystis aeruginosa CACIAM 03]
MPFFTKGSAFRGGIRNKHPHFTEWARKFKSVRWIHTEFFAEQAIMTIATGPTSPITTANRFYFHQSEARVTMELDNVAHGLKHFAQQLRKTTSAQARFALVVQLKTWTLNKPTLQTLMTQYLDEVERTQQVVHLDPESHNESIESLCEQLVFLSAVFEQESELIDQMAFADPQLMLCD